MVCIYCGSPTQVINSRPQKRQNHVWRRRQCLTCGGIFTTHELTDLTSTIMVRYDTTSKLTPFSRDKLFVSIYEACRHRPNATDEATDLTDTIVTKVLARAKKGMLDNGSIREVAAAVLRRFDKNSATIFEAYHSH